MPRESVQILLREADAIRQARVLVGCPRLFEFSGIPNRQIQFKACRTRLKNAIAATSVDFRGQNSPCLLSWLPYSKLL